MDHFPWLCWITRGYIYIYICIIILSGVTLTLLLPCMIPGLWLPMTGFSFRTDQVFWLGSFDSVRCGAMSRAIDVWMQHPTQRFLTDSVGQFQQPVFDCWVGGFRKWMEMGKPQLAGRCVIYENGWFRGTSILGNLYFSHFQPFSRSWPLSAFCPV